MSGVTSNLNASNEFLDGVTLELEEPVPIVFDDKGKPVILYFDEAYPYTMQVVNDWIAQNQPKE